MRLREKPEGVGRRMNANIMETVILAVDAKRPQREKLITALLLTLVCHHTVFVQSVGYLQNAYALQFHDSELQAKTQRTRLKYARYRCHVGLGPALYSANWSMRHNVLCRDTPQPLTS